MKHLFCAVLLIITGLASAEAQVASHAPTMQAPKATTSAGGTVGKSMPMMPAMQVTGKPVAKVNGVVLTDKELLREMYTIFPYAKQHNGFPKAQEAEIEEIKGKKEKAIKNQDFEGAAQMRDQEKKAKDKSNYSLTSIKYSFIV